MILLILASVNAKFFVHFVIKHSAIGTFNYLNGERRYVAAALIPPKRIDVYDERSLIKSIETDYNRILLPKPSDDFLYIKSNEVRVIRSPLAPSPSLDFYQIANSEEDFLKLESKNSNKSDLKLLPNSSDSNNNKK